MAPIPTSFFLPSRIQLLLLGQSESSWFLNLMVMHVVLTAVVAPWLGYEIFDRQGLSVVWNKQMAFPLESIFHL